MFKKVKSTYIFLSIIILIIPFTLLIGKASWVLIDETRSGIIGSEYTPLGFGDENTKTYNGENQQASITKGEGYDSDKYRVEYYLNNEKIAGEEGVKNAGSYIVKVFYDSKQVVDDINFIIKKAPLVLEIKNNITYGDYTPTIENDDIKIVNDGLKGTDTLEDAIGDTNNIEWNYARFENVGTYPLNLEEPIVSQNYDVSFSDDTKLTVDKKIVNVTWPSISTLTYNGTNQMPKNIVVDGLFSEDGVEYKILANANDSNEWSTTTIDADNYKLKVVLTDENGKVSNYELANDEYQDIFTINPKKVSINWKNPDNNPNYWQMGVFYNGENQMPKKDINVIVNGLVGTSIDGVDYIVTNTSNLQELKNANSYTIKVALTPEEKAKNYTFEDENTTHTFLIAKLPVKFIEEFMEISYENMINNNWETFILEVQKKVRFYETVNGDNEITNNILMDELIKSVNVEKLDNGIKQFSSEKVSGNIYNVYLSLNNSNFDLDPVQKVSFYNWLKFKTVLVNNTYYTIEEALNIASSSSIILKADTDFASTNFASKVNYSGDSYYTIKQKVTLVLPYSATDTVGSHPGGEDLTNVPSNFNNPTLYLTLNVPANVNLINNGTLVVGALTGAQSVTLGHIGRISGGYSVINLSGTITTSGTLNVYGNIIGTGAISATSGTIRERFEVVDWPGGNSAGGRFLAHTGSDYTLSTGDLFKLIGGGTITASDPNEFPFEEYRMQAILGPTLRINYNVEYLGNLKIYTSEVSQSGVTVPEMISVADLCIISNANGNTANGLIGLKSGAFVEKQVVSSREKITINGDAVGGIAKLNMSLIKAYIQMDTSKVKFPISRQIDLIFKNGTSSSQYGYEFMSGSTVTIGSKATVTVTNNDDGLIMYKGSKLTVGNGGTLNINGKFGGEILGEENANLSITSNSVLNNSGYIGGTGTRSGTTFKFTGTPTTVLSTGKLSSGIDSFTSGSSYQHNGNYWCTKKDLSVTFDANGGLIDGNKDVMTKTYSNHNDFESSIVELAFNEMPSVSREYYEFVGWSTNKDASPDDPNIIKPGMKINLAIGDDNILYAIWRPIEYTFNYEIYQDIEGVSNLVYSGNITSWNIENSSFDLTNFMPQNAPQGYIFDGWYLNSDFTNALEIISKDNIMNFITSDNTTITLYGRYEKEFTAELKYVIDEEFIGTIYESDVKNIPSSREIMGGDALSDLPTVDSLAKDNNTVYEYYFAGWFDKNGNMVSTSTTVSNSMANEDGEIIITAKWYKKAKVTIIDRNDKVLLGYYKPGSEVENILSLISFDPHSDDYNVDVNTYFDNQWQVINGTGISTNSRVDLTGKLIISQEDSGAILEVSTIRVNKVQLIVTITATGKKGSSGFGAKPGADVTASATVSFPDFPGKTISNSVTGAGGAGGLLGGKDGKTETTTITAWLKPGQRYAITVTEGSITYGDASGVAGTEDVKVTVSNS